MLNSKGEKMEELKKKCEYYDNQIKKLEAELLYTQEQIRKGILKKGGADVVNSLEDTINAYCVMKKKIETKILQSH